mgnify:CR=1 FL=1
MSKEKLSVERVRALFTYNPSTGCVTYRVRHGRMRAGMQAGSLKHSGYVELKVDGVMVRRSRIAWALFHGRWPTHHIDHMNRNRSDDRIANLRDVSPATNSHNQGETRVNNTSGVVGVSFNKRQQKFVASIYVDGRCVFLGQFATLEAAANARRIGKMKHHADGLPTT